MKASHPLTPEEREQLASAAAAAAIHAYAPYSRFRVGAAVLDEDGRLHIGCNIENASYGLCLCAERNALSTALATGARRFRGIGVACIDAAPGLGLEGRTPCGACRQWMVELAPDAEVVIAGGEGRQPMAVWPVSALLPEAFRLT